jgi:predicted dithiol-disulfide oxidoreductase (DUF899 family)
MFGDDYDEGCVSCSFWIDGVSNTVCHLKARDTAFALVSSASPDKIAAYQLRMGWRDVRWFSCASFQADFGAHFTRAQIDAKQGSTNFDASKPPTMTEYPGISVFETINDDDNSGSIALTYQTWARGLDWLNVAYHYIDLTPKGRQEQGLPWSMAWLKRHDRVCDIHLYFVSRIIIIVIIIII